MAKATFTLADEADTGTRLSFSIETDAPVTDGWLQALQAHIAGNLPDGITWAAVRRYSIQVEEPHEVDPLP